MVRFLGGRTRPPDLESLLREKGIEVLDRVKLFVEEPPTSPGRNHGKILRDLGAESRDESIDEIEVAEDDPRLQIARRVLADDRPRDLEFHRVELGCRLGEGSGRELHLRRDRASEEGAVLPDEIEVDRGTEVEDQKRSAMKGMASKAVRDSVGSNVPGPVDEQRNRRRIGAQESHGTGDQRSERMWSQPTSRAEPSKASGFVVIDETDKMV